MKIIIVILFFFSTFFACSRLETQHGLRKSRTAIILNPLQAKHFLTGHPENPIRIEAILTQIKKEKLWEKLNILEARAATFQELKLAHDEFYIKKMQNLSETLDLPYFYSEKWSPYKSSVSYEAAASAAGALIELTEAVAQNKYKNGFAIIRPPGHHALKNKGMGFCIFNNLAISSLNLIQKKLATKILIVDIDAHHGNGIEEIVKGNENIQYISFHQGQIFPYSGNENFLNIHNVPLPFLFSEKKYKHLFEYSMEKIFVNFKPEIILVSAGYDAHWRDYMSNLGLSLKTYSWIAKTLKNYANQYSNDKIVFSLEGGYDLEALSMGVSNTLKILMEISGEDDSIGPAPEGFN